MVRERMPQTFTLLEFKPCRVWVKPLSTQVRRHSTEQIQSGSLVGVPCGVWVKLFTCLTLAPHVAWDRWTKHAAWCSLDWHSPHDVAWDERTGRRTESLAWYSPHDVAWDRDSVIEVELRLCGWYSGQDGTATFSFRQSRTPNFPICAKCLYLKNVGQYSQFWPVPNFALRRVKVVHTKKSRK